MGLRVPGRFSVRNEETKCSQPPCENEWFLFSDSGGCLWLLAQPTFIQNDLVVVKAMNSGVGPRKETTNFSIENSWFRPRDTWSTKLRSRAFEERRVVSQTQESIRSAGEIKGRRTQQILKRMGQQMRESQADKFSNMSAKRAGFIPKI